MTSKTNTNNKTNQPNKSNLNRSGSLNKYFFGTGEEGEEKKKKTINLMKITWIITILKNMYQ